METSYKSGLFARLATATLAAIMTLGLGGCGAGQSATGANTAAQMGAAAGAAGSGAEQIESAVLVLGNHANAPKANTQYPQLVDLLRRVAQTRGYLALIAVDGKPVVYEGGGSIIGSDAPTERIQNEENANWVSGVLALSEQVVAQVPQSDPLEALRLATRAMSSAPDGVHHIVIIDSGLATSGPISFLQEGMIDAWPSDVADYLAFSDSLVLFDSNTVIDWYGLGDVADPQMRLTNHNRNNLKAIWQEIITRGKGSVVFHDDAPVDKILSGLPEVSVVDLQAQPLPTLVSATQPVIFDDATLHFYPNTADFIDEQNALDILRPYAVMLANDPTLFVHLVGTTANGSGLDVLAGSYQLSLERANKVRDALIALGAPAGQMEAEGQAYLDIWHLDEFDQYGNYLPNVASQNRKVVMLDAHMPHECVL